ncbi:MAG: apolipoprotein N-acyltransferase [Planctomycetota bacterium]
MKSPETSVSVLSKTKRGGGDRDEGNRANDLTQPSDGSTSRGRACRNHEREFPFSCRSYGVLILLAVSTLLLKSLIFEPVGLWPIAFVCLVPWLILVSAATLARRVYFLSYACGLAFFLVNMRWLYEATGWGYLALSAYQAAYFPLMAMAVRHAARRRRWPLALVFPLAWVGSEIARAVFFSGFPWFFLSHSLYRVLTFIQVSDLVGAYGVSFVVAAVNGAVVDFLFARADKAKGELAGAWRGRMKWSAVFAGVVVAATIGYGQVQLHRDTIKPGPKIAVLQGDYLSLVDGDKEDNRTKMREYLMKLDAASSEKPDVYLLPESPWTMYLNPQARGMYALSRDSYAVLQDRATRLSSTIVTGCASLELTPTDMVDKERRFNSASVFWPDGSELGRYDKVHVVPFGEAVPFRYGRLRFLYLWMNQIMPFSGPDGTDEFSIASGEGFGVFSMRAASRNNQEYRFGIPICYEDVMPYVSRAFVSGGKPEKQVDLLLNISNDGWFGRGHQQPQHFAICVFRAVENRVGIARAVNTGISGFIEPDGRRHDLVYGDSLKRWPGLQGYAVASVGVDSRYSFYSQHGDWFAWGCAAAWLVMGMDYWVFRVRGRESTS